jgi:hypothetical protein
MSFRYHINKRRILEADYATEEERQKALDKNDALSEDAAENRSKERRAEREDARRQKSK